MEECIELPHRKKMKTNEDSEGPLLGDLDGSDKIHLPNGKKTPKSSNTTIADAVNDAMNQSSAIEPADSAAVPLQKVQKGSKPVRNAEKDRASSCAFADRTYSNRDNKEVICNTVYVSILHCYECC